MKILVVALLASFLAGGQLSPLEPLTWSSATAATPTTYETEPNDTLATATFLGGIAQGIHGIGQLTPGDVDVWSTWLGLPFGPSEWWFKLSVTGSAHLEVSVAQLFVMPPFGLFWRRLAHKRGDGVVHFPMIEFEHWPQSPIPYLFVWVSGEPQDYTVTVP